MGGLSLFKNHTAMSKNRQNRYNGLGVEDVFAASSKVNAEKQGSPTATGTGSSIWDSIKGEIGGWASTTFSGIQGIVAAKNPATVQDNTPKVLAIAGIGVAAVILVIVLILVKK
jgi:hypothetical protein